MHLHDHPRPLLQRDADVVGHQLLGAARRPGTQPGRVVEVVAARLQAGAAEAGPALARLRRVLGLGRRHRRRAGPGTGSRGARRRACPGRMFSPVMNASCVQVRVEHEAAVVVGAGAVGRGRACTPRASSASTRRSPARSGSAAAVGVATAACVPWRRGGRRPATPPRRRSRVRVPVLQPATASASASATRARPRVRRAAGHPGWPAHRPAAEHVQVRVEHGLVGGGAGVEHQAVALAEALLLGDRGRGLDEVDQLGGAAAASAAAFGSWRRGMTSTCVGACGSMSRNATVVAGLVHHVGRDVAGDDLAEQAVVAWRHCRRGPASVRHRPARKTRVTERAQRDQPSRPRGCHDRRPVGRRHRRRAAVRRALPPAGPAVGAAGPRRRDAEEVVQDSFVAMHGRLDRLRDPDKALAYLRQTVVNRSRSVLRHRGVCRRARRDRGRRRTQPGADEDAMAAERRAAVLDAMRTLPRPAARGARAALLPRPLRGGHRLDPRHQPRCREEPCLARRRRPALPDGGRSA